MKDAKLIEIAKKLVSPRRLSPFVQVAGVACALVTDQGNTYTGVCIDADCGIGFCAEHNAIGQMITGGESKIETIVAYSKHGKVIAPCGRCREFIYQVDNRNIQTRILLNAGAVISLSQLLPELWLPGDNL